MKRERERIIYRKICLFVSFLQRQYVFIYRSLLEYYLYGNTRIEAHHFRSAYVNLKKNKQILLLAEYNVKFIELIFIENRFVFFFLQKLSLLPVENTSQRDAHLPDNIDRNRHPQIVPCKFSRKKQTINSTLFFFLEDDRNRVCLSRILGHPYINASIIEVKSLVFLLSFEESKFSSGLFA